LLAEVMATLAGEVDFVLFGMCPKALRPFVREFQPGVPFDCYQQELAALDLDLALAPLAVNRFNECKSNLRLLEYGVLGWPVVATDIAPYQGGLPVTRVKNAPAAWVEAIRTLALDPPAALAAGAALQRAVMRDWMLADHLEVWAEALFAAPPSAGKSAVLKAHQAAAS
jgi:glycosyltransferase involved in cell wall biosynthesis